MNRLPKFGLMLSFSSLSFFDVLIKNFFSFPLVLCSLVAVETVPLSFLLHQFYSVLPLDSLFSSFSFLVSLLLDSLVFSFFLFASFFVPLMTLNHRENLCFRSVNRAVTEDKGGTTCVV